MVPFDEDSRKLIYREYKKKKMIDRLFAAGIGISVGIVVFWLAGFI
tara:strand:- start:1886 stop:2023 length:138 start_codon:yes stop_codon:yes gene_type:complete